MNTAQPFVLGVNYWPRRKAMYWWSNFDAGEVREEFSVIAELGLQKVRLFLLWEDFQPTPDQVSPQALANLVQVADIAADSGLELDVTFFTGHMSGPNWAPPWLLGGPRPNTAWLREIVSGGKLVEGGYRNQFHDPQALAAEELLLQSGSQGPERSPRRLDLEPGQRARPVRLAGKLPGRASLGAAHGGCHPGERCYPAGNLRSACRQPVPG